MKKTYKNIIIGTSVLGLVGIGAFAIMSNQDKNIELVLKNEKAITVEYGDPFKVPTIEELVDTSEFTKEQIKAVEVTKNLKIEEDKDYLALGTHELTITFEEQAVTKKVEVKDTTAPVVEDIETVSFEEGTEYDLTSHIKSTDLSKLDTKIEGLDHNLVGEQKVTVTVTDEHGNESKKDVVVNVTPKPQVATNKPKPTTPSTPKPTTPTPPVVEENTPPPGFVYDKGDLGILFDTEEEMIDYMENPETGYMRNFDNLEKVYGWIGYSTGDKFAVALKYR